MRWLKDNAVWLLLVIVAVLGFVIAKVVGSKAAGTLEGLRRELALEKAIINEKAMMAKAVAESGHARVVEDIKRYHATTIEELGTAERAKVEELTHDPEALLEHLLRIGT